MPSKDQKNLKSLFSTCIFTRVSEPSRDLGSLLFVKQVIWFLIVLFFMGVVVPRRFVGGLVASMFEFKNSS